jgi:hypothetical protein
MTEPARGAASPTARRPAWGILLVVSALWLGFGCSTVAAGRWLVPAGSGLAGPPIALGYGLASAVVLGVTASLLAWKAPLGGLRAAAVIAVLLGFALTAALVIGVVVRNAHGLAGS